MELETINKLFLELSQFATAKTEREIHLEKNQISKDQRVVSNLILHGGKSGYGRISSCLVQDFVTEDNHFNVTYEDGTTYRVTITIKQTDQELV